MLQTVYVCGLLAKIICLWAYSKLSDCKIADLGHNAKALSTERAFMNRYYLQIS